MRIAEQSVEIQWQNATMSPSGVCEAADSLADYETAAVDAEVQLAIATFPPFENSPGLTVTFVPEFEL